jgi:hypothetical protein
MDRRIAIAGVIIALALGLSIVTWTLSPNLNTPAKNATGPSSAAPPGGVILYVPTQLTLHSPQYVESLINHTLILPDAKILGPSYTIVGAYIDGPVNLTAASGQQWNVMLFISSGASPFVNGTTTDTEILKSKGIQIDEVGLPTGGPLNSAAVAQSILGPTTVCVSPSLIPGPASSCTTQSYAGHSYIATQNGLSIIVNPEGPVLSWTDDRNYMGLEITAQNQTVQQLLDLASSMTQVTSTISP